jgi:hypothetical protein
MSRHRLAVLLAFALAAACQAEPQPRAPAPVQQTKSEQVSPLSGLPLIPLEIRSGGRTHLFMVEVARTEGEQAYGLMNRTRLGPDEGMIFPFSTPRRASFWMKDTLIPLDMIFIRADGSIARIAASTTPRSLSPVAVGEPVAAVLEIAGGRAAALGITSTARVSWPGGPRP